MSQNQVVSVLGCGWLGLPLAENLVKTGYSVKGSTTTPEKLEVLAQLGIEPYLIDLQSDSLTEETFEQFLEADILIFNIPPKLRSDGGAAYLLQIKRLLQALVNASISRVLFVSSTSVYPDLNRIVSEEDVSFTEDLEPSNMLLRAEQMFQDNEDWLCTIVRFGGLVGGSRHPGRFLAGKKELPNGDAPVNMIHLDDCIAILQRILEQEQWGRVYNACADKHPMRKDFFKKAAESLHLTPPQFVDMEETGFKLVSNQKLKDDLAYSFIHPDPMTFF